MKATGLIRRIDDLGRVVIPKEIRRTIGIQENDPLAIFVDGDKVVVEKYVVDKSLADTVSQSLLLLDEIAELSRCDEATELRETLNKAKKQAEKVQEAYDKRFKIGAE